MAERNIFGAYHKKTQRDYTEPADKVDCMIISRKYDFDYWDGDRKYGYGGYKYDGRQKAIAEKFIQVYDLQPDARILDVGCGKGFLMHEFKLLLPESEVWGIDISEYAIGCAPDTVRQNIVRQGAEETYPWEDKHFDMVLALMTLHNLELPECEKAVREISRVGKQQYIYHEAFTDALTQYNLQHWAKTAWVEESKRSWLWILDKMGYTGDYEFACFE